MLILIALAAMPVSQDSPRQSSNPLLVLRVVSSDGKELKPTGGLVWAPTLPKGTKPKATPVRSDAGTIHLGSAIETRYHAVRVPAQLTVQSHGKNLSQLQYAGYKNKYCVGGIFVAPSKTATFKLWEPERMPVRLCLSREYESPQYILPLNHDVVAEIASNGEARLRLPSGGVWELNVVTTSHRLLTRRKVKLPKGVAWKTNATMRVNMDLRHAKSNEYHIKLTLLQEEEKAARKREAEEKADTQKEGRSAVKGKKGDKGSV